MTSSVDDMLKPRGQARRSMHPPVCDHRAMLHVEQGGTYAGQKMPHLSKPPQNLNIFCIQKPASKTHRRVYSPNRVLGGSTTTDGDTAARLIFVYPRLPPKLNCTRWQICIRHAFAHRASFPNTTEGTQRHNKDAACTTEIKISATPNAMRSTA